MSALKWTIQQICPQCIGTGLINITQTTPELNDPEPNIMTTTCTTCNGDKRIDWGYINVPEAFTIELVQDIVDALP